MNNNNNFVDFLWNDLPASTQEAIVEYFGDGYRVNREVKTVKTTIKDRMADLYELIAA